MQRARARHAAITKNLYTWSNYKNWADKMRDSFDGAPSSRGFWDLALPGPSRRGSKRRTHPGPSQAESMGMAVSP